MPTINGIATIRAQVSSVGRLKNMQALCRTSLMLRTGPGGGSAPGPCAADTAPTRTAGSLGGIGEEQAVMSNSAASAPRFQLNSMQRTVDLLGQLPRHPVDGGQIVNACAG